MKMLQALSKKCGIYRITPEDARILLEDPADKNRPLKRSVALKYARRMKANLWKLTGEPIILNEQGALLDGQHRLHGCIQSGVPFETVVLFGDFKFTAMGQALVRGGDAAIALNVSDVRGHYVPMSAISRLCIIHDRAMQRELSPYTQSHAMVDNWTDIDNSERVRWVQKNLRALELFQKVRTLASKSKLLSLSPTTAGWFLAERVSPEEAGPWFEGLITGSGLDRSDVRLLLRQSLSNRQGTLRSRVSGMELLHWIAKAWARRKDSSRQVFAVKTNESFPFFR